MKPEQFIREQGLDKAREMVEMKEKVFSDWYHQTRDITARAGFDAAWQHQQAKVEELQEENQRLAHGNTSYYNQAIKQNERIEELQKRVDAAKILIQQWRDVETYSDDCANELEQALKGEG